MREEIQIETIRCEKCINKLAQALGPIKGIDEVRVIHGASSLVVDYAEFARNDIDTALVGAGFRISGRKPATM